MFATNYFSLLGMLKQADLINDRRNSQNTLIHISDNFVTPVVIACKLYVNLSDTFNTYG
jgi:hypothetical protein